MRRRGFITLLGGQQHGRSRRVRSTIAQHAEAGEAWALAVRAIVTATGFGEEAVRA